MSLRAHQPELPLQIGTARIRLGSGGAPVSGGRTSPRWLCRRRLDSALRHSATLQLLSRRPDERPTCRSSFRPGPSPIKTTLASGGSFPGTALVLAMKRALYAHSHASATSERESRERLDPDASGNALPSSEDRSPDLQERPSSSRTPKALDTLRSSLCPWSPRRRSTPRALLSRLDSILVRLILSLAKTRGRYRASPRVRDRR